MPLNLTAVFPEAAFAKLAGVQKQVSEPSYQIRKIYWKCHTEYGMDKQSAEDWREASYLAYVPCSHYLCLGLSGYLGLVTVRFKL